MVANKRAENNYLTTAATIDLNGFVYYCQAMPPLAFTFYCQCFYIAFRYFYMLIATTKYARASKMNK